MIQARVNGVYGMRLAGIAIALIFGAGIQPAVAAGKHEHGRASLNVAVEGERLIIELDSPADNLLGFEHRPASDAEKARLAGALATLRDGAALFAMPPGADCRLRFAAVSPPEYGGDGHADFEASWEFRCGNMAALEWLEARLFAPFPGIGRLATSILAPAGQKAVVLTPGTTRALLPR